MTKELNTEKLRKRYDDLKQKSLKGKLIKTFSILIIFCLTVLGLLTFFITKISVTRDVKNTALEVTTQTKNYIEAMLTTVDTLYADFYANKDLMELINKSDMNEDEKDNGRSIINAELTKWAIGNSFNIISGMTFYSEKGLTSSFPYVARTSEESDQVFSEVKNKDWYEKVMEYNGKPYWLSPHEEKIVEGRPDTYLSSISIIRSEDSEEVLGILKIDIKANVLTRILDEVKIGENGEVLIIDEEGRVVSSKDKNLLGTAVEDGIHEKTFTDGQAEFDFKLNGQAMYGVAVQSRYNNWKYEAIVPKDELFATATSIGRYMAGIMLFCLIVCVFISIVVAAQITKPIDEMIRLTQRLAKGDLTVRSRKSRIKEINQLSEHFNEMAQNLNQTVKATMELSDETGEASNKLSSAATHLKDSVSEVSLAIQDISKGSMEQVERTVECKNISGRLGDQIGGAVERIKKASTNSSRCSETVEEGKSIIQALNNTSIENASTIKAVVDTIKNLGENTEHLFGISERIENIASQTNMLSLNASIEAARSGAEGKGFAVVAVEVRKLAMQAQEAAEEIDQILEDIKGKVKQTISIAQVAQSGFVEETNKVNQTVEAFDLIKDTILNVVGDISDIMEYMQFIEKEKESFLQDIEHIASISEGNASATEETMALAETQVDSAVKMKEVSDNLNNKAEKLNQMLGKFTIEEMAE